jgi:hypothetical protein
MIRFDKYIFYIYKYILIISFIGENNYDIKKTHP